MQRVHPTTGCCEDTDADLGYRGKFTEETNRILGVRPTLPDSHPNDNHPNDKQGPPRRDKDKHKRELRGIKKGIVERTFSWFDHSTEGFQKTTNASPKTARPGLILRSLNYFFGDGKRNAHKLSRKSTFPTPAGKPEVVLKQK